MFPGHSLPSVTLKSYLFTEAVPSINCHWFLGSGWHLHNSKAHLLAGLLLIRGVYVNRNVYDQGGLCNPLRVQSCVMFFMVSALC